MKRSGILLINPGLINLAVVRLLKRGKIYIFENNSVLLERTIKKFYGLFQFLKIEHFEYKIGVGDLGCGVHNSFHIDSTNFAEDYLKKSGDESLLKLYNDFFKINATVFVSCICK